MREENCNTQEHVQALQAPFPWFGGKVRAAPLIWQALGNIGNYVEPFAGSLATLLARPHDPRTETVNDKDALIANAWRAIAADHESVAQWCDWPVNEADQHAIHTWLLARLDTLSAQVMGDPDYYDAQIAGRWLYGICCWIGAGWCSGDGPWQSVEGQLAHSGTNGARKKRVHLGNAGRGVHRKCVHLGNAGRGSEGLYTWFGALQTRLRYVRVCCGDWSRVLGPSVTFKHGLTGILLDPPYSAEEDRYANLYRMDDLTVAHAVREWCLANGNNPLLRIVLCGYGDIHDGLLHKGWTKHNWITNGGFGNHRHDGSYANKTREMLWCSPHCQTITTQLSLFGG